MFYIYPIKITQESKNSFVAECPQVEGAWAEGRTAEEAVENCKDAIKGVLEYRKEHNITDKFKIKNVMNKSFTVEYPFSYA